MAEIHGKVSANQRISGGVTMSSAINGSIDKDVKDRLYRDYNLLHNKPSIEGVELIDNKTLEDFGITRVLYGTTEYWNRYPSLIAQQGTVYVYTDHKDLNGDIIPGFKIGDGTSYLIDMAFTDADIADHINNTIVHITQDERSKWNNKVSVEISAEDPENLVFITG